MLLHLFDTPDDSLRCRVTQHADTQLVPELPKLLAVTIGHRDPVPALARPDQRGIDELQAAPFIKEARDDFGAPALLQEAALDQVRRAHVLAMGDRQFQVRHAGFPVDLNRDRARHLFCVIRTP